MTGTSDQEHVSILNGDVRTDNLVLTALWAAGLFCTAVPTIHSTCVFISSVDEGAVRRACSGSHILSLTRSRHARCEHCLQSPTADCSPLALSICSTSWSKYEITSTRSATSRHAPFRSYPTPVACRPLTAARPSLLPVPPSLALRLASRVSCR